MTPDIDLDAIRAARTWAAEHDHAQPDDRMLAAYGRVLLSALTATRAELEQARKTIAWGAEQIPAAQAEATEEVRKRELAEQQRDATRAELAEQRSRNLTYLANQGALNQRLTAELEQAKAQRADYARALLVMRGAYHATHDVTSDSEQFVANVEACDWPVCVGGRMAQAAPAAAPKPDEPTSRPFVACELPFGNDVWCGRQIGHDGDCQPTLVGPLLSAAAGVGDGEQDTATTHQPQPDVDQLIVAVVKAACACVDNIRRAYHDVPNNPWLRQDTRDLVAAVEALSALADDAPASVQGAADGEAQA